MTPYDEQQVTAFLDDVIDTFADAGRIPKPVPDATRQNLHALVFVGRLQFDVDNGLTYAASRAKHLAEVRLGLGLAPAPSPAPAPTPTDLSADHARQIVFDTANEFYNLTRVFSSDQAATDAATELLGRTIWHLQQAGFQAGKQRNPSGLISGDKVTIQIEGAWHIYDIFSLGFAGRATTVQFVELTGADTVPDSGIPD